MVVVDRFSKCMHAIPTTMDVIASRVAQLFRDHIWKLMDSQKKLLVTEEPNSYQTSCVASANFWKIRIAASSAYHPQTDGQMECVNQKVEQFLWIFVNQHQDDWDKWLSIAEFSYYHWVHAVKEYTGYFYQKSHHLHVFNLTSLLHSYLVLAITCGTMPWLRVDPLWFCLCEYTLGLFGSSDTCSFVPIFNVDVWSIVSDLFSDYISR